jgi:hypothetical protein
MAGLQLFTRGKDCLESSITGSKNGQFDNWLTSITVPKNEPRLAS